MQREKFLKHRGFKLLLLCVVVMVVMAGVLAGCGGNNNSDTGANPDTSGNSDNKPAKEEPKDEEPFRITMMNRSIYPEIPKPDNPVIAELEKLTNTDLDITWVPGDAYDEKITTSIAAGDLPMVLMVNDNKMPTVINAVRAGAFWEIGPYLKDYPNIDKYMNKQIFQNIAIEGKIYALYRARTVADRGMIFRKDWAEKLGIKPPSTVDELYEMIKAFTEKDPDGNGQNDTIGIAEQKEMAGFNFVANIHGAPNEWEVKDGKLSPAIITEEYLNALKFWRKLYSEKLINQDFPIATRAQKDELLTTGKAGMYISGIDQYSRHKDLPKIVPGAELDIHSRIGDTAVAGTGYTGVFMFPKQSVKTEEDLKRILAYFDRTIEADIATLTNWGVEGVHYTVENGVPKKTEAQSELSKSEVATMGQLNIYDYLALPEEVTPLSQKELEIEAEIAPLAVFNPAQPFISQTQTEKGNELKQLIEDARIKFIVGQIDEAGWQQVLQEWRDKGGNQIIEELTAAYQANQ